MKYKEPKLYRMVSVDIVSGFCSTGNKATVNPSCTAGPDASAGGCSRGQAASSRCLSGDAADTKCDTGTSNSHLDFNEII